MRDSAHGHASRRAVLGHPDHRALKSLKALTAALDHLDADAHGVTGEDVRNALFELLLFDTLDDRSHGTSHT